MANILDNFLNLFSKKTDNSVLGIDIGASSIKIVQLRSKSGKAVLQTYGEISLGPYANTDIGRATKLSPEKVTEALTDLLREAKTSTLNSAVSIPMRSSMVSVFRMPNLKDKQLEQMIPIEARKYIPVPISEVALDWFVIPEIKTEEIEEEKKFIEAMVVAIHNDVFSAYNSIVSMSNLKASFFEVEMFSTPRAVLDTTHNKPVMMIDIGAGATKVYITERGIVRDSHIISRGSQDITLNTSKSLGVTVSYAEKLKRNYGSNEESQDAALREVIDTIMGPIFSDASNILQTFQQKHKKDITKVILVGGGALLSGTKERAQNKFGIEVVEANPFSKVEVPAFLSDVLRQTGLSFTVAIGLALRKLQELE